MGIAQRHNQSFSFSSVFPTGSPSSAPDRGPESVIRCDCHALQVEPSQLVGTLGGCSVLYLHCVFLPWGVGLWTLEVRCTSPTHLALETLSGFELVLLARPNQGWFSSSLVFFIFRTSPAVPCPFPLCLNECIFTLPLRLFKAFPLVVMLVTT